MSGIIGLVVGALLGFFIIASLLSLSPLLPQIIEEFGLTYAEGGLLFTIPLLVMVFIAFFAGSLGDRVGVWKTVGLGSLFLAVGSPARAFSQDFPGLLAFTSLVGVAYGLTLPNLPKLVGSWFSREKLGKVTAIYLTGFYAGASAGLALTSTVFLPILGSWRGALLVIGALSVIISALWWALARDPPRLTSRQSQPTTEKARSVLGRKEIWLLAVIISLFNVHFFVLTAWLPTFFFEGGIAADIAAVWASSVVFMGIPAMFALLPLSDRVGKRKPFLWVGTIGSAAAVLGLWSLPLSSAWVLTAVIGVLEASVFGILYILPVELVEPEHVGQASGVMVSVGFAGGIVGPIFAGWLRDSTGSFAAVLVILSVLAIVAATMVIGIPETGKTRTHPP